MNFTVMLRVEEDDILSIDQYSTHTDVYWLENGRIRWACSSSPNLPSPGASPV